VICRHMMLCMTGGPCTALWKVSTSAGLWMPLECCVMCGSSCSPHYLQLSWQTDGCRLRPQPVPCWISSLFRACRCSALSCVVVCCVDPWIACFGPVVRDHSPDNDWMGSLCSNGWLAAPQGRSGGALAKLRARGSITNGTACSTCACETVSHCM
jgi:hypothetical protein